jgi:DNA-binding beta-propeller fold protein YncE
MMGLISCEEGIAFMVTRRFCPVAAVWLCALAGCVIFGASAQALTVHVPGGSFGSAGSGVGQLKEPLGVAVNDATHTVYVADSGNNRVERWAFNATTKAFEFVSEFAPPGGFSEPTGIAIDNSGSPLDPSDGDVYVIDAHHKVVDKFSAVGVYEGQLTGPSPDGTLSAFGALAKIAVAPSGELWVAGYSGEIYNFSDALVNQYLAARPDGAFGSSPNQGLAVDQSSDLYFNEGEIAKLNSAGVTLIAPFCGEVKGGAVLPTKANGVAGDWQSGEVFVDNGGSIGVCGLSGEARGGFAVGAFSEHPSRGIAVDESDGAVYATAGAADQVLVFDAITLPTVRIGGLSEQLPRSVTLNGTVDPEGVEVSSCVFEYDTIQYAEGEAPHGSSEACKPASVGSGSTQVAVSRHLEGLTPETKYYDRLVARNTGGASEAIGEFTAGPILGGEFVTDVASQSATLGVGIDPNGADTHYYFQYGPTVSYGSYVPVQPPGVDLGAGAETVPIGWHLQGLQPATLYHYRVVVVQNGEEFDEPDHTFTTQSVAGGPALPDGRAWELVSPANKKGALIEPFGEDGDEIQAAGHGGAITYLTAGPAVGEHPQGKNNWSQTISARADGGGGWRSEDLTLPRRIPGDEEAATSDEARPEYQLFSPDLSLAVVEPPAIGTPPLSSEVSERSVYLRDNIGGSYLPLVTARNVPPETKFGGKRPVELMYFVTATPDLSHVVLASPFALTGDAVYESTYPTDEQWNLYEWSAGRLQLVNILPADEGGEATRGAEPLVRLAGGKQVESVPSNIIPSAVSSDGRRIAWDLGEPGSIAGGYVGLFVRDMVEERTLKVGGKEAVFQWMSSDGSEIFYLEAGELYVFDFDTGTRTDLSADHAGGESSGGVQELVSDVSQDGSYVYFVAKGVLGAASDAVSGGDNLYLLHHGAGEWNTTYIATLSAEDEKDWNRTENHLSDLSRVSSRVSPNGRYLAFMSNRPLTGYDNTDALSGHADEEVFLYEAESGRLVCASCDPTGARPVGVYDQVSKPLLVDRHKLWTGHSEGPADSWLAGSIPGWDRPFHTGSQYQPRYLSDSGRLFFNSVDALVPRATNGLEDVYEYEPVGVGGCTEATATGTNVYASFSGGCVGLISSGTSREESAFFDASESGDDVFFITAAKLVGADYDNGYDVYDAHVCSSEGVACVSEPVPAPTCSSGDSCKAAPSPQPEIFGPAPSATFSGSANVVEEAKPKAKTKRKGKKKTKKRSKSAKKKRKGKRAATRASRSRVGRSSGRGGR